MNRQTRWESISQQSTQTQQSVKRDETKELARPTRDPLMRAALRHFKGKNILSNDSLLSNASRTTYTTCVQVLQATFLSCAVSENQ